MCEKQGGLHWLVSTGENGRRFVTIFNNEGNERDLKQGDIIHHEADNTVKLTFKEPADVQVIAQSAAASQINPCGALAYTVKIPAAGFVVLEF